jgi:hypothetical protein
MGKINQKPTFCLSTQSGSDDDYESKSGKTSSQRASEDEKSDYLLSDQRSTELRKETAADKLRVSLPRLKEPAHVKAKIDTGPGSKPRPKLSKPNTSKVVVEPSRGDRG